MLVVHLHAGGDAAAVVGDGNRVVGVDGDDDVVAVAGQRFVDGVVDDFVDAMVETRFVRITDVHTGSLAHGLEALEALDVGSTVAFVAGVLAAIRVFLRIFAHVLVVKWG